MEEEKFQSGDNNALGVATGNWGCGVFGGNLKLKSMLQWLVASQAGRPYGRQRSQLTVSGNSNICMI